MPSIGVDDAAVRLYKERKRKRVSAIVDKILIEDKPLFDRLVKL
jgi:hypothetical protein